MDVPLFIDELTEANLHLHKVFDLIHKHTNAAYLGEFGIDSGLEQQPAVQGGVERLLAFQNQYVHGRVMDVTPPGNYASALGSSESGMAVNTYLFRVPEGQVLSFLLAFSELRNAGKVDFYVPDLAKIIGPHN